MADPSASPVDRLLGGYLLLTALAVAFPHRPEGWPVLLSAHLALGLALLAGAPHRIQATTRSKPIRVLVDWYPLLLMPALYWELPMLGGSLWGGHFFDAVVQSWEARLFGGQPSADLAGRLPWLPLSELLHLFYLAYYPVIYLFPAVLYIRGRRESFRATVFAVMFGFTACYVVFTLFPVQGPRYLFPAPGGAPADGWVYQLTHRILENGSSQGAAFPSSHAAIAAVQTVNARRYLPKATPLLALITAGICAGAVYGGFHYGIDMVIGAAFGFFLGWLAPSARRALA